MGITITEWDRVAAVIGKMSKLDLKKVNGFMHARWKRLTDLESQEAVVNFKVGDKVWFTGRRIRQEGTITRIGKNVGVQVGNVKWTVGPTLLHLVTDSLPPMPLHAIKES